MLDGVVEKIIGNNTAVVVVTGVFSHSVFKKVIRSKKKFLCHFLNNNFKVGDNVKISPCRPYSKRKKHIVL